MDESFNFCSSDRASGNHSPSFSTCKPSEKTFPHSAKPLSNARLSPMSHPLPIPSPNAETDQIPGIAAMTAQPQPPERRVLHRPDDPASVLCDAEMPYGGASYSMLSAAVRSLFTDLSQSGIPHLLVGALAMLQHVDGRSTRNIDLIVALDDLDKLSGFRSDQREDWFTTGTVGSLRVHLWHTALPFFATVMHNHAETRRLLNVPIRCATLEGLVLLKLFTLPSLYRQGKVQRAALYETDILQLLLHQPRDPEGILLQLQAHMPASDIKALGKILHEIQQRATHQHHF